MECGWGASRTKNTYLRSKYNSLLPRRGQKRAIVAIGHKILIASYYILKDKVEYRPRKQITDTIDNILILIHNA